MDSRLRNRVVIQMVIRASDWAGRYCCSVRADPANHSPGKTGSHLSRAKFPNSLLTAAPRWALLFCEPVMILELN